MSGYTHIRQIGIDSNSITRDKEDHYIMIKKSILQEDVRIINVYAPKIKAPKYIRQILTEWKGEIDNDAIIPENFNIPLSTMDCPDRISMRKQWSVITLQINRMDQTFCTRFPCTNHSIQLQCNILYSEAHVEHSPTVSIC